MRIVCVILLAIAGSSVSSGRLYAVQLGQTARAVPPVSSAKPDSAAENSNAVAPAATERVKPEQPLFKAQAHKTSFTRSPAASHLRQTETSRPFAAVRGVQSARTTLGAAPHRGVNPPSIGGRTNSSYTKTAAIDGAAVHRKP